MDLDSKIKNILTDNYCEAGKVDKDGVYHQFNTGNCLYVSYKRGGWCFRCCNLKENMYIKFPTYKDGSAKSGEETHNVSLTEIVEYISVAKKYAILTPLNIKMAQERGNFNITKILKWENITDIIGDNNEGVIDSKNENNKKSNIISKRDLITQTARQLGGFTVEDVNEVYTALENVVLSHLNSANKDNPITVKFGNGLSVTSKIKEVDQIPRMWYHAKVSRHYNRVTVNELAK